MRAMTSAEVLAQFEEAVDGLAKVLDGVDGDTWSTVAEAPPGHVRAAVGRAARVVGPRGSTEHDIVLPLGLDPVVEDDEVAACLLYAAALGPAFLASTGSTAVRRARHRRHRS